MTFQYERFQTLRFQGEYVLRQLEFGMPPTTEFKVKHVDEITMNRYFCIANTQLEEPVIRC